MNLKYRITYNILKLVSNFVQSLKPSTQFSYANKLGFLCYRFLKIRQKEARKNISIAFPKISSRKRENILNVKNDYDSWISNIFVNGDCRGYALKIDDKYIRENNIKLHCDWGGYGIIAPDFN